MARTSIVRQVSAEGVGLGWKGWYPDHRDKMFSDRRKMRAISGLPRKVDYFEHQSPVRNQEDEGSCVGHGVAGGVDWLRRTDLRKDPAHRAGKTIYGPRWAYYWARQLEGGGAENVDGGAYVRLGVKGAVNMGAATEGSWKYKAGQFKLPPTPAAKRSAKSWALGEYDLCPDLDSTINALAAKHPVVGGFMCHTGMWTSTVDRTGFMPLPKLQDKEDGGHCVLLCGYDMDYPVPGDLPGVFLFKNSWSEKWGNGFGHPGYGLLLFGFVRRKLWDDGWAMIREK